MTPKEKAEELVLRMYKHTNDVNILTPTQHIARQCALVAVYEIQKLPIIQFDNNNDEAQYDYWQEVKQEIEKL